MLYLIRLSSLVWRHGLFGPGAKLFFGAVFVVLAVAQLAAVFSPRQPATVALDAGISAYKVLILLLGVVWVQEFICRDLDRKSVLLPLSCPLSRSQYLLSRFIGILGLLGVATVFMAIGTWMVAQIWLPRIPHAVPIGNVVSVMLSFVLLFFEQSIILAFTVMIASVATVQALPMFSGIAFALICRSIGPAVVFLTQVDGQHHWVSADIHHAVGVLEWVLPDLSRFDLRGMALYSDQVPLMTLMILVGLAISYAAVFLLLASAAFSRRDLV